MRTRENLLDRLRQNPNPDVLIVGGGINGIGLYRELTLQGVNVVLVERNDFCSGASTALSRMIHGGLRYMENGEFALVREALQERNRLLRNAPHYVAPLATVIPVFDYFSGVGSALSKFFGLSQKPGRRGAMIVKLGLSLYDFFTRKDRVLPSHGFHGKAATFRRWPAFHPGVKCSATYFDAWITYPERLGLEMIRDMESSHPAALALNYMTVDGSDGNAVYTTDGLSGQRLPIYPKMIVNATGAWIDFTNGALSSAQDNKKTELVGGTKGSHLVIQNTALLGAIGDQMVYYENQDGRVCILFPYFGNVLVGSTDLKLDDPEGNRCEDFERDYILESLSFVFPGIKIDPADVLYAFSGVRPLTRSDSSVTGQISRDHICKIITREQGFNIPVLCMIGGKWTTFRAFAELAAGQVMAHLGYQAKPVSRDLAIGGGKDYPADAQALTGWIVQLSDQTGLAEDALRRLVERYGTSAATIAKYIADGDASALCHHPGYFRREIEYIVANEYVVTAADILCRRTAIAISGDMSLALIDEILDILAQSRNWTPQEKEKERTDLLSRLSYFHGLSEETLRQRKVA